MNSAQTIVQTLDRNLERPAEIIVFGAAALLLDERFAGRMAERKTNDIDIIIPDHRELQIEADASFWKALEATNRELEKQGLYITHIFAESQVVLTPEWKEHLVKLSQPNLSKLTLQRPRVLDLVVSKMGRGDSQDVADVRNMLQLNYQITGTRIRSDEIGDAAVRAHVPEVYREIFPGACERIVAEARKIELTQKIAETQKHSRGCRMGL